MIEALCHEIYTLFFSDTKEDTRQRRAKTNKLATYFFHHPMTFDELKHVCELERKLVYVKGTHKAFIEDKLFFLLTEAAIGSVSDSPAKPLVVLSEERIACEQNADTQHRYRMAWSLIAFAEEIFDINITRDSFNSKRKVLILELLMPLSYEYDIPEAYTLSLACLQSKKPEVIWAACEYLETSCKNHGQPLGKEAVELLDTIIRRAKDRAVVAKATRVQGYA